MATQQRKRQKPSPPLTGSLHRQPKRRAKRGTGEQRILDAAAIFFAEQGFRASTRDLARRLGVTQALLYRYFPSKQALIDRVFETIYLEPWDAALTERLLDPIVPLGTRLTEFYTVVARRSTPTRSRLFMRAGLDDQGLAERYTFPLNDRILTPVVIALRHEAGLPTVKTAPLLRAERELAMTLHGAIAHLNIRKNIYGSPLPDDLGEHVAFYIACFLEGAVSTIRRIHEKAPGRFLAKPLGGRKGTPIE